MNQAFGQLNPENVLRQDGWSNRNLGDEASISIATGENPYVIITDRLLGTVVDMDREDAIEAAKAILTEFKVPFCNRVSDGTPTP